MQTGVRSDGRKVTDVRPIQSICSLLPRTHGSALFTRGETQVPESPLLHPILVFILHVNAPAVVDRLTEHFFARHPPVASSTEISFSWSMQALVVTTLGGDNMGQRVDNLTSTEDLKRFYLQVRYLYLGLAHVFLMVMLCLI